MRRISSSRSGSRRGAVAVQVAVCFTALFSVTALAVDGGVLMAEKRHAQATADAAALTAATELYKNRLSITSSTPDPGGKAKASALATAAANGYTSANSTVTVNIPPQSGNFVNQLGYAEVLVQYNQTRSFSAIFGTGTLPVPGRAVARGRKPPLSTSILVLQGLPGQTASAAGALTVSGNGTISVPGAVIVDSTNAQALQVVGTAGMTSPKVVISGGDYVPNGGLNPPSGNNVYTNVMPQTTDPFASLPAPSQPPAPSPTPAGWKPGSKTKAWTPTSTSGTVSLSPGYYQGGISVSGSTSVTLGAGIYYLGGPLTWSSSGTLDGTAGVLLYVAPGNSNQAIKISSQPVIKLEPPSSGPYQGITIFEDRTSTAKVNLVGGSGSKIDGMIYAPKASVTISGQSNIVMGQGIISDTLTLTGGGNFTIPPPLVQVPDPVKHDVILVE